MLSFQRATLLRVSVLVAAGATAACASSGSSTAHRSSSSSSAASTIRALGPLDAESCGRATRTADGNVRPVFCSDGHPSAAADRFYRDRLHASVLALPSRSTSSRIRRAVCADERAHITVAEEAWALSIAAAEHAWQLGAQPFRFVFDVRCPHT